MALVGKIPQSPAAMGTGVASISFLLAILLFVAWYVDINVNGLFGSNLPVYLFLSIPILIGSLILGGYLATKTSEDTSKMNIKLLIALGLIPHFLVSTIAFMNLPGWINYLDFGVYIPAIIAGRILYLRATNKALNSQATPAGTPQSGAH
jgi:cation transport ATPase